MIDKNKGKIERTFHFYEKSFYFSFAESVESHHQ